MFIWVIDLIIIKNKLWKLIILRFLLYFNSKKMSRIFLKMINLETGPLTLQRILRF